MIWDAPLDPTQGLKIKWDVPVSNQIDNWAIYGPAHMTDSYAGGVKATDSINLSAVGGANSPPVNSDDPNNWQTIRFRSSRSA